VAISRIRVLDDDGDRVHLEHGAEVLGPVPASASPAHATLRAV
jgi:hypothetical protein